MMYYQIYKTADCPKGWAYVRDYQGNKVFYGEIEACNQFINNVTGFILNAKEVDDSDGDHN